MLLYIITNIVKLKRVIYYSKLAFSYLYKFVNYCVYYSCKIMDKDLEKGSNITSQHTIIFKPDDKQYCYETFGLDVTVYGSTGAHDHGSSKVKLRNIVDYKWEQKNYPGRLIAVHMDGKYMAYVIKVNRGSQIEGMVRVVNFECSHRALIKGMSGEVLDLQFAYEQNETILGSIEETALHVHKIETLPDKILCTLLLKINDPIVDHIPKYDRLSWCPYVPENNVDIDEYTSTILVWTRGNHYQCYCIRNIINHYGTGTHAADNIQEGSIKYKKDNLSTITGAIFSPDGTTLAISFEDGYVIFYQVYFHTDDLSPRILHQWIPHNGKPVTTFFFLDNLAQSSGSSSLWKNAITGTDNNTELKVWSCETWDCTQTITFKSSFHKELNFKAEIDQTSSYLVLSDMENRGLYILQIVKENDEKLMKLLNISSSSNQNDSSSSSDDSVDMLKIDNDITEINRKTTYAFIKSISEFPLSSPILSFRIADASIRKHKCALSDIYLIDELDDYDEENNSLYCVAVHMYLVQPKSVQECHVFYQPPISVSSDIRSTSTQSFHEYKDVLNDSSLTSKVGKELDDSFKAIEPSSSLAQSPPNITTNIIAIDLKIATPKINQQISSSSSIITTPAGNSAQKHSSQISLMTPDSFHSPGKKSPDNSSISADVLSKIFMLAGANSPDVKQKTVESGNLLNLVSNKTIEEQELLKSTIELKKHLTQPKINASIGSMVASCGSSPSREVQEIFSLNDDFYEINVPCDSIDNEDDDDDKSNNSKALIDETTICLEVGAQREELENSILNVTSWPKVPIINNNDLHSINLLHKRFDEMSSKMGQLIEIIQQQNNQIGELREQLYDIKNDKNDDGNKISLFAQKIEKSLSKLIEEYLLRYERQHNTKLDIFIKTRDKQIRELHDALLHNVSNALFTQLSDRLNTIIITEIQRHIIPVIAAKLDAIKQQIQKDLLLKLTPNDLALKENLAQVFNNKNLIEVFGKAAVKSMDENLKRCYDDIVKSMLIPAYEKTSREMFKQLQDTFIIGTKDYTTKFSLYMEQYQPLKDNSDDLLKVLHILPQQLKDGNDKLINSCTAQILHDMNKDLKSLQVSIIKSVKDTLKTEMKKGFAIEAACLEDSVLSVVRSQAQTPAPSIYDIQEQIKQLLQQKQINKAFHTALLANDLNLVVYTIERADYKEVFDPCPLEQTVLLSLIQQISSDMNDHTELKQKYLYDSIFALNFNDSITKEHAAKVMKEVHKNCQDFVTTNRTNKLCPGVKMLMMAIQGLKY